MNLKNLLLESKKIKFLDIIQKMKEKYTEDDIGGFISEKSKGVPDKFFSAAKKVVSGIEKEMKLEIPKEDKDEFIQFLVDKLNSKGLIDYDA